MTALHAQTPLVEHAALSVLLGKQVYLKLENLQSSGSFKLRGIGQLCQNAHAAGASRLVCPSGGNAGFAAAVAGRALGMATLIVVPTTSPESVRERIRSYGAEVIVAGGVWDEANQEALRLCAEPGSVYVPPFDHPDIWDGNATMIDEVAAQAGGQEKFDVVVCAVGGGGLLSGIVQGLHRNGMAHVPVIAAETAGAASFAAAIEAGAPVSLPAITSIAGSLGAKRVADQAFDWTRRHDIRSAIVSDADAVDACLCFADDMRMLVEPACGAALAVAYGQLAQLTPFKRPLLVVCGGIGVDLDKLAGWKAQYRQLAL